MKSIENIGKILAFIMGLLYFLIFKQSDWFQWVIFGIILLSIGIPHGALDHVLPRGDKLQKSLPIFLSKYIGIIVAYLLLWYLFPAISLGIFLIISAFHFGQGHFINSKPSIFKYLTYFILGGNFLTIILLSDFDSTASILSSLIEINPIKEYAIMIMLSFFVISLILLTVQNLKNVHFLVIEVILLSTFLYLLPVLLGFILYFGFWHALPSMKAEFEALTSNKKNDKFKSFILLLTPFSLISFLGIGIVLYLSKNYFNEEQMILLFFILVSLISAPHIWVMNNFLEKSRPNID